MNSRIFFWNVMARVGLITGTSFLFIFLAKSVAVEWLFTLLAGIFLVSLQVVLLTRYVLGISRVMEQFIESVGKEDTPEIRFKRGGKLFRKLEERSNEIKEGMNARRLEKEKDDQILINAINSADFGLLCFNSGGEVLFANEAAKRFVSNDKLWDVLTQMTPGSPRVLRLIPEDLEDGRAGADRLVSIRLTEQKIFEETYRLFSLQDIQEELHKNESDSWQKIIRVLTHEIMNAVAPMLSLTKSLQSRLQNEKGDEKGKIANGLRIIETTGKGLVDFTEEYRRLSLLPSPKKEKIGLSSAINGIILLFEKEVSDRDIQLITKLVEPGIEIFADPQQFEMIMNNLLRNAMESFEENRQNRQIVILTQVKKNRVEVMVEDNGCGIPEKNIDQIFVPFFSTKEQGSGIGLSLIRQIMNKHEGSIRLESKPGSGTRVSLMFNSQN